MPTVRIRGGGPAGACAALSALRDGAMVELHERSTRARHKVCGEFLSPEIAPVLDRLGVLNTFLAAQPARVRRMALYLGRSSKVATLPEAAYGFSRYRLDSLLLREAEQLGMQRRESGPADIDATGRAWAAPSESQERLFGFKTHFEGPVDDAVDLFFHKGAYTGVNCVEGGLTNVCGLAPERILRDCGFQPEELLTAFAPLRERVAPLRRTMKWYFTGPLEFRQRWRESNVLLAGDALSFVDPFTGSGLLCAAVTGSLAGVHAARHLSSDLYLAECRRAIRRPFAFASALRALAESEAASLLLRFVPARALFRWTRPR